MPDLEILRVPNFEYSGFYFPEIAARLRRYARIYAPEITNEDARNMFIQSERAFSLVGHYNNVLLDMMANEVFLKTARLPESVKYLLSLINYNVLPSSPAQVEMLGTLARQYTSTTRILEANRKFATKRTPDEQELVFENTEAVDTTYRTDQISDAYTVESSGKTGTCSTYSNEADILIRVAGSVWNDSDINNYIQLSGSVLGNNVEDLRIIELLDENPAGSGNYDKIRLENASFISETGLTWKMREISTNHSASLIAGLPTTIFTAPAAGDKFYFGHADIMWDRFDATFNTFALNVNAIWEFYDDSDTTYHPDSITVDPAPLVGWLQFDLSSFLGVEEATDALIRVMHIPSGATANAYSEWTGVKNVVNINGYMEQVTPSTTIGDYLVFCNWRPISVITDTTKPGAVVWAQNGYTTFELPQSQSDQWEKFTLYDKAVGESRESYFLRYRIVSALGGPIGPVPTSLSIINGSQYIMIDTVQGKTVEDDPLGSSSGDASQTFTLTQLPYIYRSVRIFVDEGGGDIEWDEVDSFLSSYASDRHFMTDVQTDGSAIITFGDGINGRIPPVGVNNIRAIYRIGADYDGNIGANTLVVNRDGAGVFRSITNPRVGKYWVEADWASQETLERVKIAGPASLRTMLRAVTPSDCETLASRFRNAEGVRPVARAKAYEETLGPKTIELVVSGSGGSALSSSYKEELEEFFNGGTTYGGVLVTNHEVSVSNYIPRMIGYTIEVTAYSVVTEEIILQALSSLISPTALEDDRTTYVWDFGQEVPNSRVSSEIFNTSSGNVFKVVIISPTTDIVLAQRELPILDVVNTHIVVIPPRV